ncbi:MAG: exodeoxyribonuclease V subunit gamma [Desulfobacteraceae bacterium]|jgi:exodeoxyribonuclease V gamma subunit
MGKAQVKIGAHVIEDVSMGALRLFTSNRLEILAEAMAEVLRKPLASPLDAEVIVVQSKGMERWLSMQLAERHGICANCSFPFPNTLVQDIFEKVLKALPERSAFDPRIMTWRIMKRLPGMLSKPGFENISIYLGDPYESLKLFQLCSRIADTFDQYLLFRPEMIFRWEKQKERHWQAALWRELVKGKEKKHRAALAQAFSDAVRSSSIETKDLPERVSVFGISALPRFHVELLAGLSLYVEVNFFLMNPCREYWGDIVSGWEIKKRIARESTQETTVEALHLEKGNSLLASMGRLGRDFFELTNEFGHEESAVFEDPGEDHLLSCLQSDILNLRDRLEVSKVKKSMPPKDLSVQIHSCHSPMREIEVLHDRLLDMFECDPDLMPKDILVMTPDIETYAPYVQAVFDLPPDDARRIPFSIADRSVRHESGIVETFLSILDLQGSRFGASQVLAILDSDAVRCKFGFTEEEIERVRHWVKETRIRWGIDAESRGQIGLPPSSENTWRAGLARLLMGYAMPGRDEKMFAEILPYDHLEGGEAQALGALVEFVENLFERVMGLGQQRNLKGWATFLVDLLECFFLPDEDAEKEMQVLRRCLDELADVQEKASFDDEVDIRVIQSHLMQALDQQGFGFGFMTGGVTFCAILPMRSIPFKVICLVGMNGDAYPRQSKALGFDLMAKDPRPGDRSRRNDDRYLFLEAMLSAREKLYISYVGQDIRDNTTVPPSVLVSELMDYIEQGFEIPGKKVLDHVVTKHRLQGFSAEYFRNDEKRFSYSEETCRVAQGLLKPPRALVPFISKGLSEPEEAWKVIDLEDLCRFFINPAKFLLTRRLGIYLEESASIPEEREAFSIRGLDRYHLGEELLERRLEGHDFKDLLLLTRASGRLPHGTVGECLYEGLTQEIEHFVSKLASYMRSSLLEPLDVDLHLSQFRLTGRIEAIYPERLIQYRYARLRSRDLLKAWIYHLTLNSLKAEGYPKCTTLAGLDPKNREKPEWLAWEYAPVVNADKILESLLGKYWMGLKMPISLFPESSWTYVLETIEKGKHAEDALMRARNIWEGSDYKRGEREDLYYQLCFGDNDCLDVNFQNIAEEIFRPMLEHLERK